MVEKNTKDLDYLILKSLKGEIDYTSGEELAQKLKISRQALWKHIGKLTERGYEIVAVPHCGYRLLSSPDKLYSWELQHKLATRYIGRVVHHYEIIQSTQDIAWGLGLRGAEEGTIVVSEQQKKGRGRMQRQWSSPGGGVYFSLILRPRFLHISEIPQITLLAGLSCFQGIRKVIDVACSLKWPNDILIAGKKLGGILSEVNAEQDTVHFVVLGIGINVNTKELPAGATSLSACLKQEVSRVSVAQSILQEMELLYEEAKERGFSRILKEWQKASILLGRRIRVKVFDKVIEGEAAGIDRRGYLLLRRDSGTTEKISSGDVVKVNVN